MKTTSNIVATALAVGLILVGVESQGALEVSAGVTIHARADFEAPLTAHGTWVTVGSYGRCWRPTGVAVEWRPYCDGEWVWTDCGWYWQSDEPWAWACYHYGRWVHELEFGWVWIPDVEWAPAWVYWRSGGGHIGWAPRPPGGVAIAPAYFAFVEVGRFHEHHRPSTVVFNNTTIINHTTVINNTRQETRTIAGSSRKVVVNEGPGVEVFQHATGKTINAVPIQEAARRTAHPADVGKAARPQPATQPPEAVHGLPQPPQSGGASHHKRERHKTEEPPKPKHDD